MGTFLSKLEQLKASLSVCLSLSWCSAAYHGKPAKLITLSGSLCTPCHLIPELSLVSLSIFSLSRLKAWLCAFLAMVVYLASSSGTDCHGRLAADSHAVSSLPLRSQPTDCLRLPACLEQLSAHKGLSPLHYFGHKVTGNQWKEIFFLFWKRGGRTEKFLQKPCQVFQCANTVGERNIMGCDCKQEKQALFENTVFVLIICSMRSLVCFWNPCLIEAQLN